ncbi:DUF382-domain-containing protein [Aulographum hederae CBS 113979]|uniref:DUF382-domain-containing protein n=1 Tax=Aulographum hederae CBS 113979 TaxID=1176131 RepID=A0A6G1HBF5_9PEZI|nr:DUF382-domain-containing protein [Aulographum hederae CBS 113979]
MSKPKVTKNMRRRAQAKIKKAEQLTDNKKAASATPESSSRDATPAPAPTDIENGSRATFGVPPAGLNDAPMPDAPPAGADEPTAEPINFYDDITDDDINAFDPLMEQNYGDVLRKMGYTTRENPASKPANKPEVMEQEEFIPEEDDDDVLAGKLKKPPKKERKKMSVAQLKSSVKHPELVEWTDTYAKDPIFLVNVKSQKNVVPVPAHWSQKREYLSSKRGIEKPPFQLPKFIVDTGIVGMRDAVLEKQAEASLKQKQRERVQPKMGKLDVDYQKLYEAFFKYQTKPPLTRFGEVYYEGKEWEVDPKHLRPGVLSEDVKEALNIPPSAPPPWLVNMQRFGPPPSYPALKISGLNAPIPPGAIWGFHAGGYGRPPLDEHGHPLYGGDVFGVLQAEEKKKPIGEPVERKLWGELEPAAEPEEESDEDEDEEMDEDEEQVAEEKAPADVAGPGTASVDTTQIGEMDFVGGQFMVGKDQDDEDEDDELVAPRQAGIVLKERAIHATGLFGGEKAYVLPGGKKARDIPVLGQEDKNKKRKAGDVDVAVDIDALERENKLSKEEIRKQYEAQTKDKHNPWGNNAIDQDELTAMIGAAAKKAEKADAARKRFKADEKKR